MSGKTISLRNQAEQNKNESSVSSAEKTFSDETEAARFFSMLRTKILRIDEWNKHAMLSEFWLFDENGKERQNGILEVGAFIRISLKGSGKYDWVKIINIDETANEFIITVKPTFDPTADELDKTVISHFFTDEATNNFCLLKDGKKISFYVIGLNEKQNTSETKNALETVRNVAVNAAAYVGIQEGEWEKFCHSFLEDTAKDLQE